MDDLKSYCDSFNFERIEIDINDFLLFCLELSQGNEARAKLLFGVFVALVTKHPSVLSAIGNKSINYSEVSESNCEEIALDIRRAVDEYLSYSYKEDEARA